MKAILLREIKSFFGSPIGYLVIAVFLLLNGLFLWVFDGDYNILNSGFADLSPFFTIAPWILIFLIPAVTMRSFSDEKKQGTLELLLTKPLSLWQIVNGKFLGSMLLIVIAIIPTFIYVKVVSDLGMPAGNIDMGNIMGSYFGLLFLIAAYSAIGIFTSALSDNQIVAFMLSVFGCFFFYFAFEGLATYLPGLESSIAALGMDSHFKSMSRGVIDTRDVLYFISLTVLFLALTVFKLKSYQSKTFRKSNLQALLLTILLLLFLNPIGAHFFRRFDLTKDKRYTLSQTSLDITKAAGQPLFVDVYLDGEFPGEFKKLQAETQNLLEEFKAYNSNIVFRFSNPLDDSENKKEEKRELLFKLVTMNRPPSKKQEAELRKGIESIPDIDKELTRVFQRSGMMPANITVEDKGKQSQEIIFPWAVATYENRSVVIPLLKNQMIESTAQKIVNSVQNLEYAFANGFNTILNSKEKTVAVIKGNGEISDQLIGDFIKQTRENYHIAPFTLDSVAKNPDKTLADLKHYQLAIIAKPTEKFTDEEKQVLDQYIMAGGKTIWLVDQVNIEMDSLYNDSGTTLAYPRDLNLNDMLFKYGVRINPTLVKDLRATPIAIATGEQGSATQYTQYPWFYSPLVFPASKNPIVGNVDGIKFEFANGIDTLKNGIKKTVLLKSSAYSKLVGAPVEVNLNMVAERPEQSEFANKGDIPVAVLLEGKFHSVYENRVLPFADKSFVPQGRDNKMIVVSDGDVIKNGLDKNFQPLELGYDKWTNKLYGNKEFMMNCVNYLLDDNGLINIRSKEVNLPLLDKEKVYARYTVSQFITVGLPIVILAIFGLVFTLLRKRKYAK